MKGGNVKIEVSNGDIVDKASILMIKLDRISSPEKIVNIQKELDAILPFCLKVLHPQDELFQKLKHINETLWDIEDSIRRKESEKNFDDEFIELARSVYIKNDIRHKIKQQINIASESNLQEEKSYEQY